MVKFKDMPIGAAIVGAEALIVDLRSGITKRNTRFYTLNLQDLDGEVVKAQVWEEKLLPEGVTVGDVVSFDADVSSYQGTKQFSVQYLATATKTKPSDYIRSTDKNIESMWDSLVDRSHAMQDGFCKYLLNELIESKGLQRLFKKSPAATKVHNNWVGGLIEHAHAMCSLADAVCAHYKEYYPSLNSDLVITGCILHDLGKVFEYDGDNPAFPKTDTGVLINHIVWGPAWVYKKASDKLERLEKEKPQGYEEIIRETRTRRDEVMHLMASHHGKIEWGSPVVPATIEAIILHYIDNLDTHTMHALDAIKKEGNIKGFSEKSYVYGTEFKR